MLAEKVLEQSKHTDISLGMVYHTFVCSILHQNIISTPFCLIALGGVLFHLSKRFLIFLPINIQPVLLEGIPSFLFWILKDKFDLHPWSLCSSCCHMFSSLWISCCKVWWIINIQSVILGSLSCVLTPAEAASAVFCFKQILSPYSFLHSFQVAYEYIKYQGFYEMSWSFSVNF